MRKNATTAMSVVLVVLGAAILIRTVSYGGSANAVGYIFGGGLVVAGALRLYLLSR